MDAIYNVSLYSTKKEFSLNVLKLLLIKLNYVSKGIVSTLRWSSKRTLSSHLLRENKSAFSSFYKGEFAKEEAYFCPDTQKQGHATAVVVLH